MGGGPPKGWFTHNPVGGLGLTQVEIMVGQAPLPGSLLGRRLLHDQLRGGFGLLQELPVGALCILAGLVGVLGVRLLASRHGFRPLAGHGPDRRAASRGLLSEAWAKSA